jgi:hypothetical protein
MARGKPIQALSMLALRSWALRNPGKLAQAVTTTLNTHKPGLIGRVFKKLGGAK